MALSTGNQALWSDITAIYNSLRTVQSQHELTQTAIPSLQGGTIQAATISALNTAINNLRSETHLSSTAATGITVPGVGTLIYPGIISTMLNNVKAKEGICHFTSKFSFGSKFSFSSDFSDTCTFDWNFTFSF